MKDITAGYNYNIESSLNDNATDDKMFELLQKFDEKSDKNHQDVLDTIKQQTDGLRSEFQDHLIELEAKIDTKLESVTKKSQILANKFERTLEENSRLSKINDVIIRGIPYNDNEKLLRTFSRVARAVGFKHSNATAINDIFRIPSNYGKKGGPILVKFSSIILKREFMSRFLRKKYVNLKDIATTTEIRRIYASDNLTKLNYEIYVKAVNLLDSIPRLEDNGIWKLKTVLGFVYVKYHNSNDWKKINHPDNLEDECFEVISTNTK